MVTEDNIYQKEIGLAYWYVKNKIFLKNLLIIFLICLNVFLVVMIVLLLVTNLGLGNRNYQSLLYSLVKTNPDYAVLNQVSLPQDLNVLNIQNLDGAQGKDYLADVFNPNPSWWATFDYQFQTSSGLTEMRQSYIFPQETKKIIDLGIEQGSLATNVVFNNIKWQKKINFAELYVDRFNFQISDQYFIPPAELELSAGVPISRVKFTVMNLSAYNYRDVIFIVLLKSGSAVNAVNQIFANQILSGQPAELEATFFQNLPNVNDIEIIPQVNILSEDSYLKFE